MNKKKFPEGFFTKDRSIAKPRFINADVMLNDYQIESDTYLSNGQVLDSEKWMMDYLKNHSSADVQQVVHCVKCKYRDKMEFCILNDIFINEKDFCSKGDKLDGDEHEDNSD